MKRIALVLAAVGMLASCSMDTKTEANLYSPDTTDQNIRAMELFETEEVSDLDSIEVMYTQDSITMSFLYSEDRVVLVRLFNSKNEMIDQAVFETSNSTIYCERNDITLIEVRMQGEKTLRTYTIAR